MRPNITLFSVVAVLLVLFASAPSVHAETSTPPSAPVGLCAVAGDGQAFLNWTAPLDAQVDGYWLYRGTSTPLTLWTTLGNVTSFTDVGLVNGKEYHYSVCAVNEHGEGRMSPIASVTPRTVPSAPILPEARPGNGFLELVWLTPNFNGGSAILGYRVYGSQDLNLIGVTDEERFVHANLQMGMRCSYKVSAFNAAGEGALSLVFAGTPDAAPGAPRVTAIVGGVNNVSMTWETPVPNGGSAIVGYKVYRGVSVADMTLLTTLGVVNNYTDFGLAQDAVHYYAVSAFNLAGESEPSTAVQAKVLRPAQVTISSVLEGDGEVELYWNAITDNALPALRYWVYRGASPTNLTLLLPPLSECVLLDKGLLNGMTYYYQIAVENPSGMGWSSVVEATPRKAPSAPSGLTGTYYDGYAVLTWVPPDDDGGSQVLSYKVYISSSEEGAAYLGESTTTNFTVADLVEGCQITVWVSACNSAGEGDRSAPCYLLCGDAPSRPEVTSLKAGDKYVHLEWDPPQEEGSGPVLEYLLTREGGAEPFYVSVTGTHYNDTNVTNGISYVYSVAAVNAVGTGPSSAPVNATPMLRGSLPGAPGNLTVTAGVDYIFLTWQAAADGGQPITGYEIYRGLTPDILYYMDAVQETWYNDTDLPPDSKYHYKIIAKNAIGRGNSTPVVNATTGIQSVIENKGGWSLEWLTMPILLSFVVVALGVGIIYLFRRGVLQSIERRVSKGKKKDNRHIEGAKRSNAAKSIPKHKTEATKDGTAKRPKN